MIYVWINDKILSTPVIANQWNNIVFTYDYVNNTIYLYNYDESGNLEDTVQTTYNQLITYSNKDLVFGYLYSGYIALYSFCISSI